MLVLLSPSKSQAIGEPGRDVEAVRARRTTRPRALDSAAAIVAEIRALGAGELARRLRVPPSLEATVTQWYASWGSGTGLAAVAAYTGETYRGFDVASLSPAALAEAQRRLRILSALYGVLRPFDALEPYRLDFGCTLRVEGTASLLAYWRPRVSALLKRDLRAARAAAVLNLASAEFARAIDPAVLGVPLITPLFLQEAPGGPKTVTVFTKQARGAMARWIVEEGIERPEELSRFRGEGYAFQPDRSTDAEPVFLRQERGHPSGVSDPPTRGSGLHR